MTVEHVPKFLSKITYFYLRHGGDLLVKITGKKQFSKGLSQEGCNSLLFVFKSANLVMHLKLTGLVSDAMKAYSDAKSKTLQSSPFDAWDRN